MKAQERLYSSVDGRIVREGDPAGAFLAYAIGDQIGEDHVAQVGRLVKPTGVTSQAFHDDDARDVLRVRQAEPTVATRAVAAEKLADDPNAPVLLHDRLATELADEARERANQDEALELSATSTKARLYWTADRSELVPEGHRDSAFLAYAPGDKIRRGDLDAFEALSDEDTGEKVEETTPETPTPETPTTPATPAKKAAPAKATPAPARTNS